MIITQAHYNIQQIVLGPQSVNSNYFSRLTFNQWGQSH